MLRQSRSIDLNYSCCFDERPWPSGRKEGTTARLDVFAHRKCAGSSHYLFWVLIWQLLLHIDFRRTQGGCPVSRGVDEHVGRDGFEAAGCEAEGAADAPCPCVSGSLDIDLAVANHDRFFRTRSRLLHESHNLAHLFVTESFQHQRGAGFQPSRGFGDEAADQAETVGAAVESGRRLVIGDLGRQRIDHAGRHAGADSGLP